MAQTLSVLTPISELRDGVDTGNPAVGGASVSRRCFLMKGGETIGWNEAGDVRYLSPEQVAALARALKEEPPDELGLGMQDEADMVVEPTLATVAAGLEEQHLRCRRGD